MMNPMAHSMRRAVLGLMAGMGQSAICYIVEAIRCPRR